MRPASSAVWSRKFPAWLPARSKLPIAQKLLELTKGARQPFTRYLPEPETRAGQLTRQGLETALTTVAQSVPGRTICAACSRRGRDSRRGGEARGRQPKARQQNPMRRSAVPVCWHGCSSSGRARSVKGGIPDNRGNEDRRRRAVRCIPQFRFWN